jgi:hypothetical protein
VRNVNRLIRGAIAGAILGASVVAIGFWIDGFDFNARGSDALDMYISSILGGAAIAFLGAMIADLSK